MEIRPSKVRHAGLGLFTIRKWNKGETLTCFGTEERAWHGHFDDHSAPVKNRSGRMRYGRPWQGQIPSGPLDPSTAVGHLINDRCTLGHAADWEGIKGLRERVRVYEAASCAAANVWVTEDWRVVARRDLEQGEELYLHYGAWFWVYTLMCNTHQPLQRLACYVYQTEKWPESFVWGYLYLSGSRINDSRMHGPASDQRCTSFVRNFLRLDDLGPLFASLAGHDVSSRLATLLKSLHAPASEDELFEDNVRIAPYIPDG